MIKALNLTKKFNNFTALAGVSFEIDKGEIIGFLGPNGAGKTTTMRILTGFMPPTSGQVEIDEKDIFEYPDEVKEKIGYLPENNPLYLDMEVNAYLDFLAQLKHLKKEGRKTHISQILQSCGLWEVRNQIISRLSKGYKQRVGLASALVGDPAILILDEPTLGLDPKQVVEIRDLIKGFSGRKTVFLSSHILSEVEEICSRIIIINKGKIVATDTPEKLTSTLLGTERIIVKIRGDINQAENVIKNIPQVNSVIQKDNCLVVESKKGIDLREQIAKQIINAGFDLLEIKKETLELEDIFLKLTK
ncbi:MAG: ABC transporter ATP-binding protein [Patescibacteria group bacterium]